MKKTSINLCSLVESDRKIRIGTLPERKGTDVGEYESTGADALGRPAAVTFQQPAKLLIAANVGQRNRFGFGCGKRFRFTLGFRFQKQFIADRAVRKIRRGEQAEN